MKFDIHVHTKNSRCSNLRLKPLLKKMEELDFDYVFITDHNTFSKHNDKRLLPGEEVLSKKGDILALYIQESIPSKLGVEETIELIHEQGGLAIAAHPSDFLRRGIGDFHKYDFDAVEVFNARAWLPYFNTKTAILASGFVHVAGSDAHFIEEFGRTYNVSEEEDPYKAIKKGNVTWEGRVNVLKPHVKTRLFKMNLLK